MDEATVFKFGKWVEYGRVHPTGEKFSLRMAWSGSRYLFKSCKPPSIFLEWMKLHFKFGNWIDYSKSHTRGKIPPKASKGCGLGHATAVKF